MKMTDSQLKEIAKAGYNGNPIEKLIDQAYIEISQNNGYKEFDLISNTDLYGRILSIAQKEEYINITDYSYGINHLAVIRKMKELEILK